jgi:hypothetical protein
LKAAEIFLTKRRANRTSIVTAHRWPAPTVRVGIVPRAEIVEDGVAGPVAADEIVGAAGAVDVPVAAAGAIADAAGRAGEDTKNLCHGFHGFTRIKT